MLTAEYPTYTYRLKVCQSNGSEPPKIIEFVSCHATIAAGATAEFQRKHPEWIVLLFQSRKPGFSV